MLLPTRPGCSRWCRRRLGTVAIRRLVSLALAGVLSALATVDASGQGRVTGSVFADRNANGRRDSGEPGIPRVAVSNQIDVVGTDSAGRFTLPSRGTGMVFVSMPEGFRVAGRFWQRADTTPAVFALVPAVSDGEVTFIHASDTHIQPSAVVRMDRLRAIADSVRPAFVLITGDLTRDALRVTEPEARGVLRALRARDGTDVGAGLERSGQP